MSAAQPIIVFLPDTRGVEISRFGCGNLKIGLGVFTYSRLPGNFELAGNDALATCPGSTSLCETVCYAKRIAGAVRDVHKRNSQTDDVPPIPAEAKILRLHISGDFDSVEYIANWHARLLERPDVTCWAYTRSWRVAELLPSLEDLRALPNVQLFASVDASMTELPPAGWRRAWILGGNKTPREERLRIEHTRLRTDSKFFTGDMRTVVIADEVSSYVCPEETGRKENCLACGYCFEGKKNDVTFLEH